MADFVFSKIGKLTLPVLSQAIFLLSPSALKREIEVSPLEKGIDLLCFLKRQEHPSFPRTPGKALGEVRPDALAGHRSQRSILGQEEDPRRNTARFANVLLCPPRPWPALGAAQPSSPPPLPSHTRFGMETPALVQTPSLDSRFLSKPNQTKPLQCGGLAPQLAAVRVIQMTFLGSFSPSLPSACPAGEPPSQPTWCTEGLRNSACLQLTPDTAHPSLGALGKSPTLEVRPLCLEGSLFSSQREQPGGRAAAPGRGSRSFQRTGSQPLPSPQEPLGTPASPAGEGLPANRALRGPWSGRTSLNYFVKDEK